MTNLFQNAWHNGKFAAADTETTGVDPWRDRIVTATVCFINGGEVERHQWLAACPIDIPAGAQAVHGISTEASRRDGRDPEKVVREVAQTLQQCADDNMPVVLYNAAFDLTIITAECRRYGVPEFRMPNIVDGLVLDKAVDRFRKGKRTLTAACEHYKVRLDAAHDATEDALAAARVAWALAERYPDVVQIPPAELHELQVEWKREQADSFGRYLVKQGKPDDVSREWPVQSPPENWDPNDLPCPATELEKADVS